MSDRIQHIPLGKIDGFAGDLVLATTSSTSRQVPKEQGTPVLDTDRKLGDIAYWGTNNTFPQDVITDINRASIISSVIERKVDMLVGSGLSYGTVELDQRTGLQMMRPVRNQQIDDWLEDSNISLYLHEAARDWYTYYNIFPELIMGRAKDRIVRIECKDASQVRLGTMDDQGNINDAYLADWRYPVTASGISAKLHALDPYFRVPEQILQLKKPRYILPIRVLDRGQFYYGLAPWNGLRVSGWVDLALRIAELKKAMLSNLMHLRYHIEFADAYWPTKYTDWDKKSDADKIKLMKSEVTAFDKWAKGAQGQGGVYWSTMLTSPHSKDMHSLVKINEMKMSLPEGAYLQDAQEADFIICRDLGLKPSLHGISPSKSGSSAGSGSEDRIARTNHILDNKLHADKILAPLQVVSRVNGWPKDIRFFFTSYYAATLDRTMQVTADPTSSSPN